MRECVKHLWVHAYDEHVRVCAGVLSVVLCWLFLFRDGDLSVVASRPQRTTRQTPSLSGRDRTLPRPKPPPKTLARGGPEAPLAPPLYVLGAARRAVLDVSE